MRGFGPALTMSKEIEEKIVKRVTALSRNGISATVLRVMGIKEKKLPYSAERLRHTMDRLVNQGRLRHGFKDGRSRSWLPAKGERDE